MIPAPGAIELQCGVQYYCSDTGQNRQVSSLGFADDDKQQPSQWPSSCCEQAGQTRQDKCRFPQNEFIFLGPEPFQTNPGNVHIHYPENEGVFHSCELPMQENRQNN